MARLRLLLTVQNIEVECPHGRGTHPVVDCYLDSITPGHPCSKGGRCPQALVFARQYQWRSYRVVPDGVYHDQYPLQIVFLPLDLDGETWFAMNVWSGERWPVVLSEEWPHRRTPEGADLMEQYAGLIWNVPPRDKWRCHCENCTLPPIDYLRHSRPGGQTMSRGPQSPFDDPPAIDPATVPSAGEAEPLPPLPPGPRRLTEDERLHLGNPSRYFGGGSSDHPPVRKVGGNGTSDRPGRFEAAKPKPKAKKRDTAPKTAADIITDAFKKTMRKDA